ncbi:MAG: hypothetical protein ICV84_05600 [Flavisolibacter sp.]|nr:hypothetical protein [Flavisolibacter sp.]
MTKSLTPAGALAFLDNPHNRSKNSMYLLDWGIHCNLSAKKGNPYGSLRNLMEWKKNPVFRD